MKTITFMPGASTFRLVAIVLLVSVLIIVFFKYTDHISRETEKKSIQQTVNVINSALVVVFATYAVERKLARLNELSGSNPFSQLAEFNLLSANYQGEIDDGVLLGLKSGWYYDRLGRQVVYSPYYDEQLYYFSIELKFDDVNQSGEFEPGFDIFQTLLFTRRPQH